MAKIGRVRSPVVLLLLWMWMWMWGCGGSRDPVVEMQRSLAAAPEYMILLEDMREEGTIFEEFYHKYTVTQGTRSRTTDWIEVTEKVFRQYEPFLGMALVAKSDQGVNNTPHPAGYHYVGNPQYGRWGERGGRSFWEFYGQYAMMRSLFSMGGGGHMVVYRNDWDGYRTSRERRQPYFGRNREWGTQGSVTQKQKPSAFARRKAAIANKNRSFAQKVQSRTGRSRSGFGSRSRGGFGK